MPNDPAIQALINAQKLAPEKASQLTNTQREHLVETHQLILAGKLSAEDAQKLTENELYNLTSPDTIGIQDLIINGELSLEEVFQASRMTASLLVQIHRDQEQEKYDRFVNRTTMHVS